MHSNTLLLGHAEMPFGDASSSPSGRFCLPRKLPYRSNLKDDFILPGHFVVTNTHKAVTCTSFRR